MNSSLEFDVVPPISISDQEVEEYKEEDVERTENSEPTTELTLCEEGGTVSALLIVEVGSADRLPSMDLLTQRADSYCVVKFGTRVFRTTIKRRTRSPVWNEEFRVLVAETELNYDVIVEIWDWDLISNNLIGKTSFCIAPLQALDSSPLHPLALPIQRAQPRIKRATYQKNGGILYLNASLVDKEEAEQVYWSRALDIAPLFEGLRSPVTSPATSPRKERSKKSEEGEKAAWEGLTLDPLLIWQVYLSVTRGDDLYSLISKNKEQKVISQHTEDKKLKKQILVYVRETGKLEIELVQPAIKRALKLMYANKTGRAVTANKRLRQFLLRMTERKGAEYQNPNSVKFIDPFVEKFKIDMSEFAVPEGGYIHFNDFFYRKLVDGARTIAAPENPYVCVSPADCRLLVFSEITSATELWIKGENFTLNNLLESEELAYHYQGGSMMIARLAPQDYHRFHSPVSGVVGTYCNIGGDYLTVNPIAVNHPIDVFTTNRRTYTCIHSAEFGMVCYVAIGATLVGSIEYTAEVGSNITKGDEMGYFAFGGSTLLVLFEAGEIEFEKDLRLNSETPLETLVKMGQPVGIHQSFVDI